MQLLLVNASDIGEKTTKRVLVAKDASPVLVNKEDSWCSQFLQGPASGELFV
jgi:hypothetical protein